MYTAVDDPDYNSSIATDQSGDGYLMHTGGIERLED
jgi:hypothetical protein